MCFVIFYTSNEFIAKLSSLTDSKSPENFAACLHTTPCGFTQAGVSVRLGREQTMMLPALCQTSLYPRLRETARCATPIISPFVFPIHFSVTISIAFSKGSSFPFFIPAIVGLISSSILIPTRCIQVPSG